MAAPMAEEVTKGTIEVRLLFNDTVATESFLVPASEASRFIHLYVAIDKKVEVGIPGLFNFLSEERPGILRGKLYPALFLLQETSTNKHHLQHCRWTTVAWGEYMEYQRWYERVVQGSNQGDLFNVEMRLNMTRDSTKSTEQVAAFQAMRKNLTAAGMGEEDLEWQAPPAMMKLDDVNHRHVHHWHPAYAREGTINFVSIDAVPVTNDWFPTRDPVSPLVTDGTCVACLKTANDFGIPTIGKKAQKKAKAKAKRDAAEAGVADEGEEVDDDAMMDLVEEMEGEDDGEEEAGGPSWDQPLALRPKDDDMEID